MSKRRNVTRKDGRIAVQVYIGKVNGKRKYKTVYGKSQGEADEKAMQIKLAMKKGIDITADQDTFGEWADHFLNRKKSSGISESQYGNYDYTVKLLKLQIGNIPIKNIKTQHIQSVIDEEAELNPTTKKPSAKRTLKFTLSTVSQIIDLAIKNRVIDYNVAQDAEIPANSPEDHRRALTDIEQQWIVDTPHRAQRAAMIMMYAGLRRGELIPLKWTDINLNEKSITVNKSVSVKGGKLQLKPFTKTESGMRVIDIPQRLSDFLKAEKEKAYSSKIVNPLVCPAINQKMMSDTAWRRMWESYLFELNWKYGNHIDKKGKPAKSKHNKNGIFMEIPRITPHWLRHTFATLLYMSGVDVMTAKEQLGHADIKTTLSIYTHLDKQFKHKSMSKLDDYLESKNKECKSDASQKS